MVELESALISVIPAVFSTLLAVLLIRKALNTPPKWILELRDDLFTPPGEGKPAKIQVLLQEVGIGIAQSMRMSMTAAIGGDIRQQKSIDKAIGLDVLNESGIGGILDLVGMSNVKNLLAKNPQTLGMVLQRIAPLLSQFSKGQASSQGGLP